MTTAEFSQAFDAQISAYNEVVPSGEADKKLAFDEYEKSVFLTRAQDELVLSFYSGRNATNESFEYTEEVRRYLVSLVKTSEQSELTSTTGLIKVNKNSHFFSLPNNLWFITYEALKLQESDDACLSGKFIEVTPVTQDELHRIIKNPFRGPTENRALRLDISGNKVEIITKVSDIANYTIRYIEEPTPIIVDTLSSDMDIKGKHEVTECSLHPVIHKLILDRAVQLALSAKAIAGGVQK